jgi:hypothetical protein
MTYKPSCRFVFKMDESRIRYLQDTYGCELIPEHNHSLSQNYIEFVSAIHLENLFWINWYKCKFALRILTEAQLQESQSQSQSQSASNHMDGKVN